MFNETKSYSYHKLFSKFSSYWKKRQNTGLLRYKTAWQNTKEEIKPKMNKDG